MEKGKPVFYKELSWPEVSAIFSEKHTVLIPIGSTEQHGHHLPLGVDLFIPEEIAARASEKTGVPVLPTIPFVPCSWHECFPGAINVSAEVVIKALVDIAESLEQYGVLNIVLVNGHTGGCDSTLVVAADEIKRKTKCSLYIASVVDLALDDVLEISTSPVLGHADEVETSKMMAIRPDLVHIEGVKASNIEPRSKYLSVNYRRRSKILFRTGKDDWKRLAPDGYIGDPSVATAEKGEKMLNAISGELVCFLNELEKGPVI